MSKTHPKQTSMELIDARQVQLGSIIYFQRPPGFDYRRAYHTHMWEFWSTTMGQTEFEIGRKQVRLEQDEALLIPPKKRHQQRVTTEDGCLGLTVHFIADWPPLKKSGGKVIPLNRWSRRLLRQFLDTRENDDLADAKRRAIWAMLLSEIAFPTREDPNPPPSNPLIIPSGREFVLAQHVVDYLRQNLHRPNNMLADLCAQTGYSQSRLADLFKEQAGMSILEALQRLRLEEALRLLRHSSFKIKAIAERLGFAHPHKFNAFFRNRMDCTPTQYLARQGVEGWQVKRRIPGNLVDERFIGE